MHLSRGWCVNSTSALLECLYLGCIGWSSAGILLKLCLCSSSCSLVCLIFQLIVRKWMFLKTQLQIFAETNAEVWLCFFFFFSHWNLACDFITTASHLLQWERLTLVCLFWMLIVKAVIAMGSYSTFYFWSSVSSLPKATEMKNNHTVSSASPKRHI